MSTHTSVVLVHYGIECGSSIVSEILSVDRDIVGLTHILTNTHTHIYIYIIYIYIYIYIKSCLFFHHVCSVLKFQNFLPRPFIYKV